MAEVVSSETGFLYFCRSPFTIFFPIKTPLLRPKLSKSKSTHSSSADISAPIHRAPPATDSNFHHSQLPFEPPPSPTPKPPDPPPNSPKQNPANPTAEFPKPDQARAISCPSLQ